MFVAFPKLPEPKDGKLDADEMYKYLYNLQLVVKKLAEKIDA